MRNVVESSKGKEPAATPSRSQAPFEGARSLMCECLAVDILQLNSPSPFSLRSESPPPQAGTGIYPLPRSVVPPSRPFPRKRGWDMPGRRHPATELPPPSPRSRPSARAPPQASVRDRPDSSLPPSPPSGAKLPCRTPTAENWLIREKD